MTSRTGSGMVAMLPPQRRSGTGGNRWPPVMPAPLSGGSRPGRLARVDPDEARALACRIHAGQVDRSGRPLLEHVGRVAAAVPAEAATVAWLHEVLERSDVSLDELGLQPAQ